MLYAVSGLDWMAAVQSGEDSWDSLLLLYGTGYHVLSAQKEHSVNAGRMDVEVDPL